MIANETLVASDGYEVALFPMPYLYMTQDEGGDYSHQGTYNIDLVGYNGSSVIAQAPIYAPVSMKVISYHPGDTGGNAVIFESLDRVHLPNGSLDYMTIMFMHCSTPPYTTVGQTVQQGELCYRTGTYGQVTGDHVHTCVGQGQGGYFVQRASGNWDLSNRIHYWEGVYVNDTTIIVGYDHNWQIWDGQPIIPEEKKKKGFPWSVALNHWPGFML
jgi:murein DD-endopeptidase MepM/ murein hydrolase activator NlpD